MENTNIPLIQKGVKAIYRLSKDETVKELIRQREEAEALENSRLYNAERKGRADLLAKMVADGVPEEIIRKYM